MSEAPFVEKGITEIEHQEPPGSGFVIIVKTDTGGADTRLIHHGRQSLKVDILHKPVAADGPVILLLTDLKERGEGVPFNPEMGVGIETPDGPGSSGHKIAHSSNVVQAEPRRSTR